MRIGFYAPMKAPDHPVPSGDREMARLLIAALGQAGHEVEVISDVRAFMAEPDEARASQVAAVAEQEVSRLAARWHDRSDRPDLLFAYHLHYKAPDLVGLPLARLFGLPYVTAEASYARKRDGGPWAARQDRVVDAVRTAAVNLCFTSNDRAGLALLVPPDRLVDLPPFIDASRFGSAPSRPPRSPCELLTVAMMRPGDKLTSYRFLAAALARLGGAAWRLTVVGDGPARAAVEEAFAGLPPRRLRFRGALPAEAVTEALAAADLLVWPGFNEAFGLCYLEAAAAGLASVAVRGAGTPSVIRDGRTGLLTPPDPAAYAEAVAMLIEEQTRRAALGREAARFVREERSLALAATVLDEAVQRACRSAFPVSLV